MTPPEADARLDRLIISSTPDADWLHGDEASFVALSEAVERRAVGDPAAAVRAGELIVAFADQRSMALHRARARRALSQALSYSGRFIDALTVARAGEAIARDDGDRVEAARCQMAGLHPLAALGRLDEAALEGVSAREALSTAGEAELAARADLNLGAVFAMKDEPRRALDFFDRARYAFAGNPGILAQLETNRGNALSSIDDHRGAAEAFAAAVEAFESSGQHLAAAIAEGNIGFLAARRGDIAGALLHHERSRRWLEATEAPAHRARLVAEQAAVVAEVGLPADALQTLRLAIPQLDELGMVSEGAAARLAAGRAAIEIGATLEAQALLDQATELLAETGQRSLLTEALLLRAGLAINGEDLTGARKLAADAIAACTDRPVYLVRAGALLARVALDADDLVEAEHHLNAALATAESLGLTPLLAELHVLQGRLLRAQGSSAKSAFAAAVEETERVRSTLQAARYRSAFHADRLAPYMELMLESLDEGDIDGAIRASELVKSRTLIDLLGTPTTAPASANDPAETRLQSELNERRAELNWRYSRFESGTAHPADADQIGRLEHEVGELEQRLASTASSARAASETASADALSASLRTGEAAVQYVAANEELLAFIVRPDGRRVVRGLCTQTELLDAVRRLRLQMARLRPTGLSPEREARLTIDAQRELFRLWSLLLAPLTEALAASERLVIAPFGPLHMVPFAALWDGQQYLVGRCEVVQVPSLSLYAYLPERRLDTSTLIVGVSDELTPEIPAEVDLVESLVPDATILREQQATTTSVAAAMHGRSLVHLACHGRYTREMPAASGLKLADGWLTTTALGSIQMSGAHVTLSACDTGRASIEAGDELMGLTRAFFSAGVSSMLFSLWPVHDGSTARLMSRFYERSSLGATYARALTEAQRQAIAGHDHPARWAAFVYGGR